MSRKSNTVTTRTVSDVVIQGVQTVVNRRSTPWVGTLTQLDRLIKQRLGTKNTSTVWPGSPSALRVALNKVVRRLRNSGISVTFRRDTSHFRTRLVEITNAR